MVRLQEIQSTIRDTKNMKNMKKSPKIPALCKSEERCETCALNPFEKGIIKLLTLTLWRLELYKIRNGMR